MAVAASGKPTMERAGTASEECLQAATTSQTRKGKGGRKKIKGKAKVLTVEVAEAEAAAVLSVDRHDFYVSGSPIETQS